MDLERAIQIARKVLYGNNTISSTDKYTAYTVLAEWHKSLAYIGRTLKPSK